MYCMIYVPENIQILISLPALYAMYNITVLILVDPKK